MRFNEGEDNTVGIKHLIKLKLNEISMSLKHYKDKDTEI